MEPSMRIINLNFQECNDSIEEPFWFSNEPFSEHFFNFFYCCWCEDHFNNLKELFQTLKNILWNGIFYGYWRFFMEPSMPIKRLYSIYLHVFITKKAGTLCSLFVVLNAKKFRIWVAFLDLLIINTKKSQGNYH